MHAIIRRYEASDKTRTTEIVKKAQDRLVPQLSDMPGFSGYYLVDSGDGVFSSVSIFDTEAHADESTRVASTWVREEKLETALTNPPQIISGQLVVHETREPVAV
jgi:heme-degrading monooxygenase HmoA